MIVVKHHLTIQTLTHLAENSLHMRYADQIVEFIGVLSDVVKFVSVI